VAGYYNKTRLGGTFQIIPVAGPGLQWQVAVGVKRGNEQLQAALEQALTHLQPDIQRLGNQYGFPLTPPVPLIAPPEPTPPASSAAPPASTPAQSTIPAGRSLFNQHCAHCHSPNAVNPEPRTDLRRLKGRYGENMSTVFFTTVTQGRPTKGMPAWTGVLSEDHIWQILTFIESVQETP
jgi:mono/diheme cytochrome c family protein